MLAVAALRAAATKTRTRLSTMSVAEAPRSEIHTQMAMTLPRKERLIRATTVVAWALTAKNSLVELVKMASITISLSAEHPICVKITSSKFSALFFFKQYINISY